MGAGDFTYGHRIRALRKEAGLTQGQLGQRLSVSTQVISMYENGREPPYEILCNIARFFGVSTDYLLGLTNFRNPESQKRLEKNAEEHSSITLLLQSLRPDIRERFLPSLENLLNEEDDTESFAIILDHLSEIIDRLQEIRGVYTHTVLDYRNSDSLDRDELFSYRLGSELANSGIQMISESASLRKELLRLFVERDMKAIQTLQGIMAYGDTIPRRQPSEGVEADNGITEE